MKKLFPLIAILGMFILTGCPKPAPGPSEQDSLSPVKTEYTIGAEGGEFQISFKTNMTCQIKSDASWLTVNEPTKAVVTKSVKVTAAANTSTESRTAKVTITGGALDATISVVQSGLTPKIDITTTTYPIGAEGGTITVEVSSNVQYEVTPNVSWITRGSGAGGAETFTVEANDSESDRSGKITFSYGDLSKTVTVNQKGKAHEEDPFLEISPTSKSVSADGDTFTVNISTNQGEVTATPSADWVTVSGSSVTVAANASTEARTATVIFTAGGESKTLTITQAGKQDTPPEDPDVLEPVGASTFNVPAEGEDINITVRSNVNYTVDLNGCDWITRTKATTVREDLLTFHVDANEVESPRNATITFTYDEALSFTVTVKQAAYVPPTEEPYIEPEQTEVTVPAEGGPTSISVSTNCEYTAECDDEWITITATGETFTFEAAPNEATDARSTQIQLAYEWVNVFLTVVQAGAQEENPFDVGSNLSINGTANCYVVTKAGTYTFDASVMGNGLDGIRWDETHMVDFHLWPQKPELVSFKNSYYNSNTKPRKVKVIWDDNNVVTDVKLNSDMTVEFTATGNKGNALIGVQSRVGSDYDEYLWSWHIWVTDPPRHFAMMDLSEEVYHIMDRNLGATSANPEDGQATYGYWYQFGRKDPLRAYVGMGDDFVECLTSMGESVAHPTFVYGPGTKTSEWFNTGPNLSFVTADLWGNPSFQNQVAMVHDYVASRGELSKTIYDPCPPGYMVPPLTVWEDVDPYNDITILEDVGALVTTMDGEQSFYPYAGYIGGYDSKDVGRPNLGWYGFPGMYTTYPNHSWDESLSASAYSSQTDHFEFYGGGHPQWKTYGAAYFSVSFRYTDAQIIPNMNNTLCHNIRMRGFPVRCIKQE